MIGYSSSQPSQAPSFGPYNTLMCRPGQIASFPLNSSISQNGLVIVLDFYPYPGGSSNQTIVSIRDTSTNFVSLRLDYYLPSGAVNIWVIPPNSSVGNPYYVFNTTVASSISVNSGKNRDSLSLKF